MRNLFTLLFLAVGLCEVLIYLLRDTSENLWFGIGLLIVAVIIRLLKGEDETVQK